MAEVRAALRATTTADPQRREPAADGLAVQRCTKPVPERTSRPADDAGTAPRASCEGVGVGYTGALLAGRRSRALGSGHPAADGDSALLVGSAQVQAAASHHHPARTSL